MDSISLTKYWQKHWRDS